MINNNDYRVQNNTCRTLRGTTHTKIQIKKKNIYIFLLIPVVQKDCIDGLTSGMCWVTLTLLMMFGVGNATRINQYETVGTTMPSSILLTTME